MQPTIIGGKPGDERGFLHKKILGAVGSIAGILPIPGANVIGTVARTLAGSRTVPRELTARPTAFSAAEKESGRAMKFGNGNGGGDGCVFPWRRDPRTGDCRIFAGERSGPDGNGGRGTPAMPAMQGGTEPGIMTVQRSVCGRKMVLGFDGLCYGKGLSNKLRMWPKGRRPLVTGGEMNAAAIAARVGKRLDNAAAKLRAQGLMKPLPRARRAKTHHHHPAA